MNMSVSNQIYSSSIGGLNPLKNILVNEGEKLVSIIINLWIYQIIYFIKYKNKDWRSKTL